MWARLLVGVGLARGLRSAGSIWLGVPLGRLPGDIVIRRDGFTLYLPDHDVASSSAWC